MSTGVLLFVVVRSTELILEIARIKYGIDQFERSVTFFFFLKYLAFSLTLLALFFIVCRDSLKSGRCTKQAWRRADAHLLTVSMDCSQLPFHDKKNRNSPLSGCSPGVQTELHLSVASGMLMYCTCKVIPCMYLP